MITTAPKLSDLVGSAPVVITSPEQLVRRSNRWRDHYNPLRNLGIGRVVQLLEAGERGEWSDLQWLYRFIEKRFATLTALIERRESALTKLPWDVKIPKELPKGVTPARAKRQRDFLYSRYELLENFTDALKFIALARFRGFSILAKHRYQGGPNDGAVRELHWLPQWNFARDGLFGSWYFNPKANNLGAHHLGESLRIGSANLPRSEFIIREVERPINELASIAWMNINTAWKDWTAFVEIFGLPNAIVIMPPNVPPGKEADYRDAAQDVAESGSGALPHGASAEFPSASVRGNAPFKEYIDAGKEDVVLAGTGGKLTMLSDATGIGSGASDAHSDVFDDLAQGEGMSVSETLQRDFDKQELEQEFPGEKHVAYFELAVEDTEDVSELFSNVESAERSGYQTDTDEISERAGMKLTRKEVSGSGDGSSKMETGGVGLASLFNRETNDPAVAQLAAAVADDLQPLRERLETILQIADDEALKTELDAFRDELPELLEAINNEPRTAKILEESMREAMAEGMKGEGERMKAE